MHPREELLALFTPVKEPPEGQSYCVPDPYPPSPERAFSEHTWYAISPESDGDHVGKKFQSPVRIPWSRCIGQAVSEPFLQAY